MKTRTLISYLFLLVVIGLMAACSEETTAPQGVMNLGNNEDIVEDAGNNQTPDTAPSTANNQVDTTYAETLIVKDFGFKIEYSKGYTVTKNPDSNNYFDAAVAKEEFAPLAVYNISGNAETGNHRFTVRVYSRTPEEPLEQSLMVTDNGHVSQDTINLEGGLTGYLYTSNAFGLDVDPKIIVPLPNSFVYLRSDFVSAGEYVEVPVPQHLIDFAKNLQML